MALEEVSFLSISTWYRKTLCLVGEKFGMSAMSPPAADKAQAVTPIHNPRAQPSNDIKKSKKKTPSPISNPWRNPRTTAPTGNERDHCIAFTFFFAAGGSTTVGGEEGLDRPERDALLPFPGQDNLSRMGNPGCCTWQTRGAAGTLASSFAALPCWKGTDPGLFARFCIEVVCLAMEGWQGRPESTSKVRKSTYMGNRPLLC
ncbi:hypothetical protein CCMA1212_005201 [Trichoderma ghanense]|uniref:Uncharacterized protein n=1 Tax=Trichoderma ghanense TaxID=65468 RepID=A0ABY2H3G8_9HYPO